MVRLLIILSFISLNTMATEGKLPDCYAADMNSTEHLSPALLEITRNVCEQWKGKFEKISWQLIGSENKNFLNADRKIISYEMGDLRNGRLWVKVNSSLNDQQQHGIIWLRIKGYVRVWLVKRDTSVNSLLLKEDIVQRSADITTENITHDQIVEEPIGMYVRKSLRKGAIISTANVSKPPLIKQNQPIQVLVENNGLQITAKAIALSTGWSVGDTIAVLVNGASQKTEAVVTKRGWANVSI
jgi:flagella basal body P-ring formation protein FlgA